MAYKKGNELKAKNRLSQKFF